jgi:ribosomal protein L16 Arg81 hydroxylase
MVSSLQELIAPLTEPEFSEMLRTRSLVFRRGSDEKRFETLLDWDAFRRVIESDFPADKLLVTRDGEPVLPLIYLERGKLNTKILAKLLDQGASLIARRLDRRVPKVEALCLDVRAHIGETTCAAAIATTGRGGALTLHYDPEDLIILQIAGSKRWTIYDRPVACPVNGMPEQTPPRSEAVFNDILRAGDFLFLPAGHWHHCENGPDRSLHLVIIIEPPTGWHAVKALQRQVLAEEMFRMPLTRLGGPGEKAAYEALLKRRLIEKIEQMSFLRFVTEGENAQAQNKPQTKPE